MCVFVRYLLVDKQHYFCSNVFRSWATGFLALAIHFSFLTEVLLNIIGRAVWWLLQTTLVLRLQLLRQLQYRLFERRFHGSRLPPQELRQQLLHSNNWQQRFFRRSIISCTRRRKLSREKLRERLPGTRTNRWRERRRRCEETTPDLVNNGNKDQYGHNIEVLDAIDNATGHLRNAEVKEALDQLKIDSPAMSQSSVPVSIALTPIAPRFPRWFSPIYATISRDDSATTISIRNEAHYMWSRTERSPTYAEFVQIPATMISDTFVTHRDASGRIGTHLDASGRIKTYRGYRIAITVTLNIGLRFWKREVIQILHV